MPSRLVFVVLAAVAPSDLDRLFDQALALGDAAPERVLVFLDLASLLGPPFFALRPVPPWLNHDSPDRAPDTAAARRFQTPAKVLRPP